MKFFVDVVGKRPVNPSFAAAGLAAYFAVPQGHGAYVCNAEVKDGNPTDNRRAAVREIDCLVYELYGLTEEEIKFAEDCPLCVR